MKWTPQKTIASASVAAAARGEPEAVAEMVGDVLDLRQLVVVGEDDGVPLGRERARTSSLRAADLRRRKLRGQTGLDRRELLHEPFLSSVRRQTFSVEPGRMNVGPHF